MLSIRRPQIFYSFHFQNDVFRVQLIRNIGVIDGNEPVSKNDWEQAKRTPGGIERWIDKEMKYKTCVVVLIGSNTYQRPWVHHEIAKGWDSGRGLIGIYIHNLKDPRTVGLSPFYGKCSKGQNPFAQVTLQNGQNLANIVPCFDPSPIDAYNDISRNILNWINHAARS